ncbi:MAG: transcriptional repressor [Myxococcales bacterium]|nr:transcriptional repressor [Myxococcales bacterium]
MNTAKKSSVSSTLRRTRQRDAIRDVFHREHRPLRAEEVCALAKQVVPGIGLATVYRALKQLVERGELTEVRVPELDNVLYESADKGHHHHFCCRRCERILDFDGCAMKTGPLAPPGFVVESHEVYLYGVCADCAAAL